MKTNVRITRVGSTRPVFPVIAGSAALTLLLLFCAANCGKDKVQTGEDESAWCWKNVRWFGLSLMAYLDDAEERKAKPMRKDANPLVFILKWDKLPARFLFCPTEREMSADDLSHDPSIDDVKEEEISYGTWAPDELYVVWDKVTDSVENIDLPLLWEKRANHKGGRLFCDLSGACRRLPSDELEALIEKAGGLIKKAAQSQDE